MKLEAVTVCVNYGDFLRETAAHNAHLFDRWVIVTRPSDLETREVCRQHALEVILSEDGGDDFAKGRLINRGLRQLSAEGFRLHIDADIALHPSLRRQLRIAELDPSAIYGCDRVMVNSWEAWQKPEVQKWFRDKHLNHYGVNFPGFEVGTRWAAPHSGWCPIGFFQLWHSSEDEWKGSRIKEYPDLHGNACRTDVQFALKWDRQKRVLLPEVLAVHLDSERTHLGTNWNGRKTKRFGPIPEVASAVKYT